MGTYQSFQDVVDTYMTDGIFSSSDEAAGVLCGFSMRVLLAAFYRDQYPDLAQRFATEVPPNYYMYHHMCESCAGKETFICDNPTFVAIPSNLGVCVNGDSTETSPYTTIVPPPCAGANARTDALLAPYKPLAPCDVLTFACTLRANSSDCVQS